jgi:hypothetical protein
MTKEMMKLADKGTSKMEKTKDPLTTKDFKPNRDKTTEDKITDGPNRPAE